MISFIFFYFSKISHLYSEVLVFHFVQVKDVWLSTKYKRCLDLKWRDLIIRFYNCFLFWLELQLLVFVMSEFSQFTTASISFTCFTWFNRFK